MQIINIYCCEDCGTQSEMPDAEMFNYGHPVECPVCKVVTVRVLSKGRGSCWVHIAPREVEFNDIMGYRRAKDMEENPEDFE